MKKLNFVRIGITGLVGALLSLVLGGSAVTSFILWAIAASLIDIFSMGYIIAGITGAIINVVVSTLKIFDISSAVDALNIGESLSAGGLVGVGMVVMLAVAIGGFVDWILVKWIYNMTAKLKV